MLSFKQFKRCEMRYILQIPIGLLSTVIVLEAHRPKHKMYVRHISDKEDFMPAISALVQHNTILSNDIYTNI